MAGPGDPRFDPGAPPIGDEQAMRNWWEQLDRTGEAEDPQYLESAPAEGEAVEPARPAAAPRPKPSRKAPRGLFAELSRDDLARAFVLGEVLGPPRSRRGRR